MSIKIDIAESDIKNAIAIAITESFAPDKRDSILRDLIRAHLGHRENSYDKETILSKRVGEMVRSTAIDEIKKIFDTALDARVRTIVQETLGQAWVENVVTEFKASLAHAVGYKISVSVSAQNVEY